jgi:hypothetical protein
MFLSAYAMTMKGLKNYKESKKLESKMICSRRNMKEVSISFVFLILIFIALKKLLTL